MPPRHSDLTLIDDPIAQELLRSTIPARLAYVWRDGSPRVVPLWFHWNGAEFVLGSPLEAPKVRMLSTGAKVALTIDSTTWPYKALQVRGTARVETVAGVVPEYREAAARYLGAEPGRMWIEQVKALFSHMARIAVRPEWVGIMDFERRFPSAIESAMSAHQGRGAQ
ncbi:MAG: pyridoxamine 5'-phosphate oxidase family protein [Steroidobacteraceae bacterium]